MIDCKGFVRGCVVALALIATGAFVAFADAPPVARVARLTFTEGYVHVDRAGNVVDGTAGDPGQLNMPLMEGQTVVTGDNGQAEVEFEDGSVARLTPNSSLLLARMTGNGGNLSTQLVLGKGLAYFELRSAQHFAYTVAAASDRITPVENTTFRVTLDEPPAAIAVLDGTAHVERPGSYSTDIHAGENFRTDASEPGRYFLTQEIVPDSWDQWNESRDQMAADAASQNTPARDGYAGTQGYGWSDLDANGRWYDVGGQGEVWQPNGGDAADFDPYGNGSWVWYPGAGYVWASAYPWGWTPFRCGGWSYWDTFGWGWTPNSACGGFGFAGFGYGGFGYGGRINILLPPRGYRNHNPPGPGRGGMHPIIAVHEGSPGIRPAAPLHGTRMIAGIVAKPINPGGLSYTTRGGSAVGSSLRRDYPVDRVTHTAILGTQPGQGGVGRGFVSGVVPGTQQPRMMVPGSTPNAMRTMRSMPQPGMYAVPSHSNLLPGARAPQMSAPRMAAPPPMSHPSAPAPASHAAPSGSRK